MIPHT